MKKRSKMKNIESELFLSVKKEMSGKKVNLNVIAVVGCNFF
jgi:hypothetical protein